MSVSNSPALPRPTPTAGLRALRALFGPEGTLGAMRIFYETTGAIFQINAPGFKPIVMVGEDACRWVLRDARDDLRWRIEPQPITTLLGHGPLVEDGAIHDRGRSALEPALHKQMCLRYGASMSPGIDAVSARWQDGQTVDMLVEVRKMALLILIDALFGVDFAPDLERLWDDILRLMHYIAPGLWLVWSGAPAPGYRKARAAIDGYWDQIIALRRAEIARDPDRERTDMLSHLIALSDRGLFDDSFIRDELMTMLVAGHDTTTAAMAWAFYLLGRHPDVMARLTAEIDERLGGAPPDGVSTAAMPYLNAVWEETLRLYPPAHTGNRLAVQDLEYRGYRIPAGSRVMYSIYLTQRMSEYFPEPERFNPDRALDPRTRGSYTQYRYLPFGGGKRNCVGKAFADVMGRVVVARALQTHTFALVKPEIRLYMGATIEPRPGVIMRVQRRR